MAATETPRSPPPTPPLKDITRGTPSPEPDEKVGRPARASSPDCCPICLDEFSDTTDRAYSDNCFHIFCFECLHEWSNNKRECPLCKKPFKAIIHKFKDNGSHAVHTLPAQPPTERFSFNSTISFEWVTQMRQQFLLRQRFRQRSETSRSSALPTANPMRPHTAERRRALYQHEIYCEGAQLPGGGSRYRRTTPEFYRSNPAVVHRLMPWLNRELVAILPHIDNVNSVLDQIIDLIKRHDIRSASFRNAIRPYIRQYTDHFVHEFHMFAMSPLDMATFDRHAQYPHVPGYRRLIVQAPLHPPSRTLIVSNTSGRETAAERAAAGSTTLSTADRAERRRSWHHQRLRDSRLQRLRGNDVVGMAGSSAHSAAHRPYHRFDMDSSDSDSLFSFSEDRARLNRSQRAATNRLERAMRFLESGTPGVLMDNSTSDMSRPLSERVSEPNHGRPRSRPSHQTHNPVADASAQEIGRGSDMPVNVLASSSRLASNTTAASSRPNDHDRPAGLPSEAPDLATDHSYGESLFSVPANTTNSALNVIERARRFLDDNVQDQPGTSFATVDHQRYTAPPLPRVPSSPLSVSTGHSARDPFGIRQLYAADESLFPFFRRSPRSSSSSSTSSVSPVSVGGARAPSPALSSHSSDVVLVSEEKPYRARTPIVISSEDEELDEEFKARNKEIPGSKRLSDSDDYSCDDRLKSPPKRAQTSSCKSPLLSQSSVEESDNLPSTSHQSAIERKMSRSSDSDCVVTFQAAKLKSARPVTADEMEREDGTKKKKKLKKRKHEKHKSKKERKLRKEKSARDSKHHKHILADVKLSDPSRAILSDYHRQNHVAPDVRDPAMNSSSQLTATSSFSSTSYSTTGSGRSSQQSKRVRSPSPLLDVTSFSEPEDRVGSPAGSKNDWFVDYTKNGYTHRDSKRSIHNSGKHNRPRYFKKDGEGAKPYKKHDKGHKN